MDTKHKPATALPWAMTRIDRPERYKRGVGRLPASVAFRIDAADAIVAAAKGFDAEYITHTANVYPKLVQTVREFRNMAYIEEKDALVARLDAFLRELGETE